ncbi:hypothetical protein DFJ77DRAFT_224736 [Powellomyces hirtus]|nr:hypothetical protein DFJ77DRAFT_224736 [Powellomyces hirtus]
MIFVWYSSRSSLIWLCLNRFGSMILPSASIYSIDRESYRRLGVASRLGSFSPRLNGTCLAAVLVIDYIGLSIGLWIRFAIRFLHPHLLQTVATPVDADALGSVPERRQRVGSSVGLASSWGGDGCHFWGW